MSTIETNGKTMLREWLKRHERSVSWCARTLGVSSTTLHSWLAGRSRPQNHHREIIYSLTYITTAFWDTPKEIQEACEARQRIEEYHKDNK